MRLSFGACASCSPLLHKSTIACNTKVIFALSEPSVTSIENHILRVIEVCSPSLMSAEGPRQLAGRPSQTCDTCKYRHQKCSGTKPACHHCALRGIDCNYSNTQAHKIDAAAMRQNIAATDSQGSATPSSSLPIQHRADSPPRFTSDYLNVHEILLAGLVFTSCVACGLGD